MVIDKRTEKGEQTFLSFVDMQKAFDNVNWENMIRVLKNAGVDFRDTQIILRLFKNEIVHVNFGKTQGSKSSKPVRQCWNLSSEMFDFVYTGLS